MHATGPDIYQWSLDYPRMMTRPIPALPCTVLGDESALRGSSQILVNNARIHTPAGSRQSWVQGTIPASIPHRRRVCATEALPMMDRELRPSCVRPSLIAGRGDAHVRKGSSGAGEACRLFPSIARALVASGCRYLNREARAPGERERPSQ